MAGQEVLSIVASFVAQIARTCKIGQDPWVWGVVRIGRLRRFVKLYFCREARA